MGTGIRYEPVPVLMPISIGIQEPTIWVTGLPRFAWGSDSSATISRSGKTSVSKSMNTYVGR